MKLLLDNCVWGGMQGHLQSLGHDVVWAGEWDEDPGDEEILARAYREGRVLITQDKDFGHLVIVEGMPHAGILRIGNMSANEQVQLCTRVLANYEHELTSGAMLTASRNRTRVRPPEED